MTFSSILAPYETESLVSEFPRSWNFFRRVDVAGGGVEKCGSYMS
jgi:hypothetical protein